MSMRRIGLALLLVAASAFASAAERLDDAPSPKRRLDAQPRWLYNEAYLGTPERVNAMVASLSNVEVRLNTSKQVGRRGRIYLVMPQFVPGLASPTGMRLEWKARGGFQSGSALPGEKALLYDGPVTQAITGDVLDFNVYLDARHLTGGLRFDPVFEFEATP
jgi:hypothetical protein